MKPYSGVQSYKTGYTMIKVHFPVDFKGNPHISCSQCRLFQRMSGRCPLTGAISEFPENYVGSECPLIMEDEDEKS